ncbi:MAG: AEC family transporter [Kiritimatiellia bacterium]|nr:AEC family transporter [Kiritimatiellia bacterium]
MPVVLQILSVILLLGSGWLARRRGWLTDIGTRELARVLLSLIAPCLIVSALVRRSADDMFAQAHLPLLTLVMALIGLGLGQAALRLLRPMPEPTRRGFLFQCLMNNYIFLPLPIVLLRYGDHGVALLLLSSLGWEIAVWTLGVGIYAPGRGLRDRIRGVLSPAVLALLGCLAWITFRDRFTPMAGWLASPPAVARFAGELILNVCDFIGRATIPLSMLVAGSRIAGLHPKHLLDTRMGVVALIRLILAPAVFLGLLYLIPIDPVARGVLSIIALMPTAVTAVAFSDRYGGDTDFVTGGLLLTHILALFTVPLFLAWTG